LRLHHFETLRPLCALCLAERGEEHPLLLTIETKREGGDVIEGVVQCPWSSCRREYPIIDGIPILVPDVRGYLSGQLHHIMARTDLSPEIEALLGEASGPGSAFDTARTHLSSYTWDHYGEWDPITQHRAGENAPQPGSVARLLSMGLELAGGCPQGPLIDAGCSVGRATIELARHSGDLVLGVDFNFAMLRAASHLLRHGSVRYPLRRAGLLYEWREFTPPISDVERLDFWACDAAHLPFPSASFGGAVCLNLLDAIYGPLDLLRSLSGVLRPGGSLILSVPYDWAPSATAVEAWIGGHSPRSAEGGRSDALVRALLTPGAHAASLGTLALRAEADRVPWTVRMHDRSVVTYDVHLVVATRSS
jgi:SAM-dependent methyltransferase/uncharacterized protein YbaR (Trm112 family)